MITLLDRVLDRAIPKPATGRYARWNKTDERRFKWCLTGKIKVKSRIEYQDNRIVLCIRPDDLKKFAEKLKECGLDNCETAQEQVRLMENDPLHTVRFEVVR